MQCGRGQGNPQQMRTRCEQRTGTFGAVRAEDKNFLPATSLVTMNHAMSRKQLLRTAVLTLKQCSQRAGRMDMPGMTLPRQIKRLIYTINLRRVFAGRLEFVSPLIVLEIMCLINVFVPSLKFCTNSKLSGEDCGELHCPRHVVAPAILNCAPVLVPRLLRCACGFVMQYCKVFF